ncbi:ATP-dependent DNA helicase [Eubacteriaceae bacterium ES3]|nr:ATP-dependent DNA helicase [Eubacteriaceae bacterium ES3]
MDNLTEIKLSVRSFVEFLHRHGDIDSQFMKSQRAVEGTKAHQKVQKSYSESDYLAEVPLKYSLSYKSFNFIIEGRADGIFTNHDEFPVIDEIKSTTRPLEDLPASGYTVHWAQAKIYAFIFATQNNLSQIGVQLTYFQLETETVQHFREIYLLSDLKTYFHTLLDHYLNWAKLETSSRITRNQSIKNLSFPYPNYRKGQRQLAISVYKTIVEKQKTFIQAPTGIGKTISTLFPAIKSIAEHQTERIFYLTAKTIVREVAEESLNTMANKGLLLKSITLTAKDKICFLETRICSPEHCTYAKGHFDRVNDALYDLLNSNNQITRRLIEDFSRKHRVCPFEFSLDLAAFCDVIICDYNYVFDPRVSLKHFLGDSKNTVFLIDEAHNLVDRGREMFSAQLSKKMILDLKRQLKGEDKKVLSSLKNLNSLMLNLKKNSENKSLSVLSEEPKELEGHLYHFISTAEEWLTENESHPYHAELLAFYFLALAYLRTGEFLDERYITYVENSGNDTRIKRFCLDPSKLLSQSLNTAEATLFFSATLSPLSYYSELLGGKEENYHLLFPSPFNKKRRALLIANNISTKYTERENTKNYIAALIDATVSSKTGHYLVFFPSYQYMNMVYENFIARFPEHNCLKQEAEMTEGDREIFLNQFRIDSESELIGFCVLGGIFSEGVDLAGDSLIGSIIIGVGLPQICSERDLIKDYFNLKNHQGFDYAYVYPGMNKVFQAAGRVIRTETDQGLILLIDSRFSHNRYQKLFPQDWFPQQIVTTTDDVKNFSNAFWQGQED